MPSLAPRLPARLAAAAAALAIALTCAPARAGGVPSGFPDEIALPDSVQSVFLVGQEYELDESGQERLIARRYELAQRVRSGIAVRRHFESLFRQLGWSGNFERGDRGLAGRFGDGDRISVDIALRPRAEPGDHLVLRVRVGVR